MHDKIKKAIEILTAFDEGKIIEYKEWYFISSSWTKVGTLEFLYRVLASPKYIVRIKGDYKCRPYNNQEEFLQGQKEHGPYIKHPLDNERLAYPREIYFWGVVWTTFDDLHSTWEELSHCEWQDGTPCGIEDK